MSSTSLSRQTDKILDTLIEYLNGDINDRYLAKKRLDDQRKVWNRMQSNSPVPKDYKKTLSEMCEIPIFQDFKGYLEQEESTASSPPAATKAFAVDQSSAIHSNKPVGDCSEIVNYLKRCPNQTASISSLESCVCLAHPFSRSHSSLYSH